MTSILLAALYFLPTIVALLRRKKQGGVTILFVNLLFGWTIIGWIIAMAWAGSGKTVADVRREEQQHQQLMAALQKQS
jgi:hypothetical protein